MKRSDKHLVVVGDILISKMSLIVPNNILFAHISELLSKGKTVTFQVKGVSMLPFLVGDRDSVNVKSFDSYKVGDAVLVQLPDSRYVLHRIISIDSALDDGQVEADKIIITLKGDGNLKGTETCILSDIRGKVVQVLKKGKKSIDVESPIYKKRVALWSKMPYLAKRIYLALYRRLLFL